jgi:hypothetical protein
MDVSRWIFQGQFITVVSCTEILNKLDAIT